MAKKRMDDCTGGEIKTKLDQAMRWLFGHLPAGDGPNGRPLVVLITSGTFAAGGTAHYSANGNRADVVRFLRETADKLELRLDDPEHGTHTGV